MPSRAERSIAACASLSTQPLFIAELPSRERNTPRARGADGATANLRQARGQLLPSARLLHQPERRGRSLSSLSAEPDTTGSIEGAGGVKDGAGGLASSRKAWGAGSRTVGRRRGGSAGWRFGNRAGDLRRWCLLRPRLGRRLRIAARLGVPRGRRFALGDRVRGRLGCSNGSGPVEVVDGACEFRLRRNLRREALALAAAAVAPPPPPPPAPAPAPARALRPRRPCGPPPP